MVRQLLATWGDFDLLDGGDHYHTYDGNLLDGATRDAKKIQIIQREEKSLTAAVFEVVSKGLAVYLSIIRN